MQLTKIKTTASNFRTALCAVKKLSAEEKQLLRLQVFTNDVLAEMKAFENQLKKKKAFIKKTDEEIVSITNSIRRKKYANAKKMLH